MRITSSEIVLISMVSLFSGLIFATFFPAAPYGVFAPAVVGLAGSYFAKRVIQKSEKYGGNVYPDRQVQTPPDYRGE
jgi:uncharacterized membrane protein YeaQ/YmgE (transglycosylase-associated protein family)